MLECAGQAEAELPGWGAVEGGVGFERRPGRSPGPGGPLPGTESRTAD